LADRLRSRICLPTLPTLAATFFIMRVSTRTPSPSNVLSVGRVEDWRGAPQVSPWLVSEVSLFVPV
jgi:hypothetical protein